MKKLDLFDKKNPFEAFTAEELNKILDAIGVAYDSGIGNQQSQKKIGIDWKILSDTSLELFNITFSTPIRLSNYPLNLLLHYKTPEEKWNGKDIVFDINFKNEFINTKYFNSNKENSFLYAKIPPSGFYDIKIKLNTNGNIVFLDNINWGW